MSKIEVNEIDKQNGSTVTIGGSGTNVVLGTSGQTVSLGTGASQSGFGRTGTVNWETTKITADPSNAVSGKGYFADTSASAFNVTLPSSPSAGDIIAVADYASNFGTNNLTIARNGSNIEGSASNYVLNQTGVSVTLVYVDATKGWIVVNAGNSNQGFVDNFVVATGGTVTTSGDFKIHRFTGPGTFDVTNAGTSAGSNTVDYLVVGGGGGGGKTAFADRSGGGAGAGGFRASSGAASGCYTAGPSPLTSPVSALPVSLAAFPVTVGGGGAGGTGSSYNGTNGSNSIFSSVTSAGGGFGAGAGGSTAGGSGGSGGGGRNGGAGGSGNTPPVSPAQGKDGGEGQLVGGGGGGATTCGADAPPSGTNGENAGAGVTSCITASPVNYAGGGGSGATSSGTGGSSPSPGTGGAGAPVPSGAAGSDATTNSGGGGGGGSTSGSPGSAGPDGGAGGSGIVVIRYKFQ